MRFQGENRGAMPLVTQMQQEMDGFFKETGLGTEHCYELCENYVPWSQWFADLGWGSLDLGKNAFWGTWDYAVWGANLGWYYTGAQALYYGAQYLPEFMNFINGKTAHLNYESEKLDQVMGLVGVFAACTPYTFPLALVIGLYYYDDLFPGEQTLIQDNGFNQRLLARMAYSAGLASMTSFWLRTWAHVVPKAGLDQRLLGIQVRPCYGLYMRFRLAWVSVIFLMLRRFLCLVAWAALMANLRIPCLLQALGVWTMSDCSF